MSQSTDLSQKNQKPAIVKKTIVYTHERKPLSKENYKVLCRYFKDIATDLKDISDDVYKTTGNYHLGRAYPKLFVVNASLLQAVHYMNSALNTLEAMMNENTLNEE